MAFPGFSTALAGVVAAAPFKKSFVRYEGAMPFSGDDLTLQNLRALSQSYGDMNGCPVAFTLTVDKDQRARLREMHAFVAAASFPAPASRSDYGAVENFTFKWKRADRSD